MSTTVSGPLTFGDRFTLTGGIVEPVTTGSGNTLVLGTSPTISGLTLTGATTLPGSGSLASGGQLYLGRASALTMAALTNQGLQVVGDTATAGFAKLNVARFSANTAPASIYVGKSRGTAAAATAVASADELFELRALGDDGSTNGAINTSAGRFLCAVDGAVSTGIVPGRWVWETMNSAGVLFERMRLYSGGDFRQGTGSALATTATDGFILIATCAGAPTGAPTNAGGGQIPLIYDKTNNKLYAYNGAWKASGAFA